MDDDYDFDETTLTNEEIADMPETGTAEDNETEIYDFGLGDETAMITQDEGTSDLAFARDIFPKVFGSQWSEVLPQTRQPVLFEGRTLLGMAMDNTLIDWTHGGQTLHLVYCIEVLLHKLHSKGWDVIVVFFNVLPYDHTSTPEARLAVKILKQHLRSCSTLSHDEANKRKILEIVEFENWWEEDWREFVVARHPSFMVLDLPLEHSEENSEDISYEDVQKILLLDMLAQNIRSISSEFRITSNIWSFELILRLPYSTSFLLPLHEKLTEGKLFKREPVKSSIDFEGSVVQEAKKNNPISNLIIATMIANTLQKDNSFEDLCKCYLICNSLSSKISLSARLQQNNFLELPSGDDERIKKFFGTLTEQSFISIQHFLPNEREPLPESEMVLLSDLIDGRLFYTVFSKICCSSNGTVNSSDLLGCEEAASKLQSIWKLVTQLVSCTENVFPFTLKTDAEAVVSHQKSLSSKDTDGNSNDNITLVDISDEFIRDMNISDIEASIKENTLLSTSKNYSTFVHNDNVENLSYYNCIEVETPEEAADKLPKRKTRKQKYFERLNRQKYYNYTEKVAASLGGKGTTTHHVVSARSDAITLKSLEEQMKEKKETDSKQGKGKGKGNQQKGKKGGKGKKGHINRKEQILAKNKEKMMQADKEQVQLAITSSAEEETISEKILQLSKKVKVLKSKVSDSALVRGYLQLIEWSMIQWREQCVVMDSEDDDDDFEEIDETIFARKYTAAVQLFRLAYDTVQLYSEHLTPADMRKIQHCFYVLGLPDAVKELYQFYVMKHEGNYEKEARYRAKKLSPLEKALNLNMSFATFQLLHCGHLMQRSFNSKPDARVEGFTPDAWQRELLDIVDSKQSALVVAPTSSGKTFISYYTMKQVVEANKKNKYQSKAKLVVYVAPTKALVRQVAAEVYAHYGPIVGIQTTSYEQSAENCQILVTVPQCLEELLLNPTWNSDRIAYCILDEIHCIQEFGTGEQTLDEGGSIVWEHIINLLPCPFLALSATIGNPQCFRDWLAFSQQRYNREVRVVTHEYRWADLKLQVYTPNENDSSILDITATNEPPKESNLSHLHPLASLTLQSIQEEDSIFHMRLSPEECYQLYHVLAKLAPGDEQLDPLNPDKYFTGLILRYDVFEYEKKLKQLIVSWSRTPEKTSIIQETLQTLSGTIHARDAEYPCSNQFVHDYFLPLLVELHNDGRLPALVFSLDRHRCNRLVIDLINKLEQLEEAETHKPEYQRRLKEYLKRQAKKEKKSKAKRDVTEKEAKCAADADNTDDNLEVEIPGADERFSFLRKGEGAHEDDKQFWLDRIPKTSEFITTLVNGLDRGIGVHHGALPSTYRTAVEVLFRGGHLKVVISTGTLSLGINMPCKTVVFAGDSHVLTPLSFRQMSGRAGRRGYDDYGNIVFFGISQYRVFSLLCAQLTTLTGGQPINPTVTLRLLNCYYQTNESERKPIAARLSGLLSPSLYSTNLPVKEAKLYRYHSRWLFRIYVDILVRLPLLDRKTQKPINIAKLVMKLYNTEPSNLLVSYFFLSDAIDDIGSQIDNQQARLNSLFLLLCHIFRPIPVTAYLASHNAQNTTEDGPSSLIVLPELKAEHKQLLKDYNLRIIRQFVRCILAAHETEDTASMEQAFLPFSEVKVGVPPQEFDSNVSSHPESLISQLKQSSRKLVVRSPFVGLSGHTDEFQSAQELADTCNLTLPIDIDQIPASSVQDVRGRYLHLNAYAWDFLKHGKKKLLVHENGFKEANAWELIRDWSEILQKLSLYLSELPKADDDRLKRVFQLFEYIHKEFQEKFERFNS